MMLRKCSSLDETMDETKVESDFKNGIRQEKGRNFISKIKRSSSSMFSSIEDELVKGKISLSDCVEVASKLFPFMYSDIIIFVYTLRSTSNLVT